MLQWSLQVAVMISVVKLHSHMVRSPVLSVNRVPLITPSRNIGDTSGTYPESATNWRLDAVKYTSTLTMFSSLVSVIIHVIVRFSEPTSWSSPKVS